MFCEIISSDTRAANSDRGLVLGVGGLGKLDRGLGRCEPFFPDSDSDSDSNETFQISRKLGLVHVEFFCLLYSHFHSLDWKWNIVTNENYFSSEKNSKLLIKDNYARCLSA